MVSRDQLRSLRELLASLAHADLIKILIVILVLHPMAVIFDINFSIVSSTVSEFCVLKVYVVNAFPIYIYRDM